MADNNLENQQALAAQRAKIDAIDENMHNLLVQRGTVIDALIKIKGTARPGAAFHPAREAAMMREIVARHDAKFPLAVVEHIWREIIGTFTHLQAPYKVFVDQSDNLTKMYDMARFNFGFSISLEVKSNSVETVNAVCESGVDLGIVSLKHIEPSEPWWRSLVSDDKRANIMTLLPFIHHDKQLYDVPCCVIAPPLAENRPLENKLFAASLAGDLAGLESLIGRNLIASANDGSEVLIAQKAEEDIDTLVKRSDTSGLVLSQIEHVGGFASQIFL